MRRSHFDSTLTNAFLVVMPDGTHFTLRCFDRREAARRYAIDYAFRSDALQVFDTVTREEIYRSVQFIL